MVDDVQARIASQVEGQKDITLALHKVVYELIDEYDYETVVGELEVFFESLSEGEQKDAVREWMWAKRRLLQFLPQFKEAYKEWEQGENALEPLLVDFLHKEQGYTKEQVCSILSEWHTYCQAWLDEDHPYIEVIADIGDSFYPGWDKGNPIAISEEPKCTDS